MKKITNAIILLLCIIMLFTVFAACGQAEAKNVPVADLTDAVSKTIGKTDTLVAVDASYIKGYMKLDAAQFGDWAVVINAYGANIDEFGIFKAGSMTAKEVRAAVDSYLQLRKDTWMEEYMPEEKPKLTNAEVRAAGDYVMYCILSDADKSAAFSAFENALK